MRVGAWPAYAPIDIRCSALVARQGEAYCQRIFHLAQQGLPNTSQTLTSRVNGRLLSRDASDIIITSISEDVFPLSLHRDCDVPVSPRSFEREPGDMYVERDDDRLTGADLEEAQYYAQRCERPCGKYALIVASGDSRVADARRLEKSLRGLGYAITRVLGTDASDTNVRTALEHMVRPPEPPGRGMGRGGWWAGGASAASVLVYISLDTAPATNRSQADAPPPPSDQTQGKAMVCANSTAFTFDDVRSALLAGARAHRPFYLQGYRHRRTTSRVSSGGGKAESQSARVLCIVDGKLDASESAELRGYRTVVQYGLDARDSSCEQPMDGTEVASVQMLVMPFVSTARQQRRQQDASDDRTGSPTPPFASLHVSLLTEALAGGLFKAKMATAASPQGKGQKKKKTKPRSNKDSVSAGMLVAHLEKKAAGQTRILRPPLSSPMLLHLYPGTISHPDVTNRQLQLHFRRTNKHQRRIDRARHQRALRERAKKNKLRAEASARHFEFLNQKYTEQVTVKHGLQRSLSRLGVPASPVEAFPRSESAGGLRRRSSPRAKHQQLNVRKGPLKRTEFISDINGRRISPPRRPRSAAARGRVRRPVSAAGMRPASANVDDTR